MTQTNKTHTPNSKPGEFRETEIMGAHQSEVIQLCFWPGRGQLLSIDSENNLYQWDLSSSTPFIVKKEQIPEDHELGYASCLTTLGFTSSDAENNGHAFIGMSTGNLYFYSLEKQILLKHSVKRTQLLTTQNAKICDIRSNPVKPHRLLIVYKDVAVVVYSMNKHEFI